MGASFDEAAVGGRGESASCDVGSPVVGSKDAAVVGADVTEGCETAGFDSSTWRDSTESTGELQRFHSCFQTKSVPSSSGARSEREASGSMSKRLGRAEIPFVSSLRGRSFSACSRRGRRNFSSNSSESAMTDSGSSIQSATASRIPPRSGAWAMRSARWPYPESSACSSAMSHGERTKARSCARG